MRESNILFVNLPTIPIGEIIGMYKQENILSQTVGLPMGILYLSSYLKKHNVINEIQLLDYVPAVSNIKQYMDIEDFVQGEAQKVRLGPDIIAFSLIFSTSQAFYNICLKTLKLLWPHAVAIVGGTHATSYIFQLLQNEKLDYAVKGEGEIGLSEFVRQYSNNEKIKVKGIYSKEDMKRDAVLENCEAVQDLDTMPFPDWDLIDMKQYVSSKGRRRSIGVTEEKKLATLITVRGCPFQCTFCSSHTVHGRHMRFRSPENVIQEMQQLYDRFGVTLFIPEDDMFTMPKNRCLEMLRRIRGLNIPGLELQLPSGLSVNAVDKELLDAIVDSGVKILPLAIESGSEYVQKYVIKKNCDLNKARKIVKYLRGKDVIVRCYFILGFFGETKEQMRETVEYAKSLKLDWCVFSIATPLIGSEMYNQMLGAGYIQENLELFNNAHYFKRNFDTAECSASELNEFVYRSNLECNFINNTNKINKDYKKAIDIYSNIVAWYEYHVVGWYCIMECYEGMTEFGKAREIEEKIGRLIENDPRSREMFEKYKDLMPKLKLMNK